MLHVRPSLLALALAVVGLAGCATSSAQGTRAAASTDEGSSAAELRLGYFPNVTHATALYGVAEGVFAAELGGTRLSTQAFNAGPAAVEALFAGALDAAYLGPNPTVNAFVKNNGDAVRIVAGATSGGAALVVRPGITEASQLRGTQLATPQAGGTQDVALRHYLAESGLDVDERGAGDVTVVAQDNSQTLRLFQAGELDGAWLPEPWVSRLVLEGGGTVLVDERTCGRVAGSSPPTWSCGPTSSSGTRRRSGRSSRGRSRPTGGSTPTRSRPSRWSTPRSGSWSASSCPNRCSTAPSPASRSPTTRSRPR